LVRALDAIWTEIEPGDGSVYTAGQFFINPDRHAMIHHQWEGAIQPGPALDSDFPIEMQGRFEEIACAIAARRSGGGHGRWQSYPARRPAPV